MTVFRLGLVLALCVLWSLPPVDAREYNKRPHIAPQTRAKIDRVLARERAKRATAGATVVRGDVVNTGCGKLDVGNVENTKPGQKVDQTVVVTGDVINVARCR
ncbi:hypothetical protein HRbin40_01419 [bacterium HR40]|nr:hypothetical protein HRbin40_01419 [bacterium HR40]